MFVEGAKKIEFTKSLIFFVNGKKIIEENVNPEWTLLYYLRKKLGLTGSKLGCGEGGCGACTVMVSKFLRNQQKVNHFPVNACLAPVCSMHGLAVTTVEGIGSTKTKLHPVQERIAKAHGSQCGFCTPGIVMSMYALLRQMEKPTMKDMEVAFQGNLCRCTGYRPIIEGYKTFTEDWELMHANGKINGNGCAMGDQCCKVKNNQQEKEEVLHDPSEFLPYDSSQELIFPPELKLSDALDKQFLQFRNENVIWFRPTTLGQLLELKSQYPEAKIVVGNTEVGVEVKFKQQLYPYIIQPNFIKELNDFKVTNDGISIGASLSLDEIEKSLLKLFKSEAESKTRIFKAILEMLNWFAGKQIRSVASLGGNIMTGSPISDLNPLLMAAKAVLTFTSSQGTRKVPMDQHFYTGYRKTLAKQDEILQSIDIPFTKENQYSFGHKQSRRRDDDIAIVNAGINITINSVDHKIEDINMAFGGLAPTTLLTQKTKNLIGEKLNDDLLEKAYDLLLEELPLPENAPGGMIDYRRTLPISFFYRNYLLIRKELNLKINSEDFSALRKFSHKPLKSSQLFKITTNTGGVDTIGKPIVHTNALKQASGEAQYTDDILEFERELHMALVYSTKSFAKIKSIDFKPALQMENVVDYLSAEDIPQGKNKCGFVIQDEEIIISETVTSQYQILGAILAKDQLSAQKAAKAVKVTYEELSPVIVSIEDAIQSQSYFPIDYKLNFGDTKKSFEECDHIIKGQCRTGYQEHFYMEPHGYLVVPKEGEEFDVFCSTQNYCALSEALANILQVQQNKIVVKVKRIGGGFGGKETVDCRLAIPVALAAKKLNRPVRFILERDEDMASTGGRNPVLIKYKVGFNKEGKIKACEFEIFVNSGYSYDMSLLVLQRASLHVTNSCFVENVKIQGYVCKTNLPTNTSFRGFGLPQAELANETILRDLAEFLRKDYCEILSTNFYSEGDKTIYNQRLFGCNIQKVFQECLKKSQYYERLREIEIFNKENRWKKRGIDITTTTFGVGFGNNAVQQAGALILVYKDGSVLMTHGGVEMGQGLHTKLVQIASRNLQIPIAKIHTNEVGTDRVPNASSTAGSISSDLNGMAILRACNELNKRLQPIKDQNPNGSWEDWIKEAYLQRISLSVTGFHAEPEIDFDFNTNTGSKLYNYYSFGACCSEVEIDCLTGDHQVLRTDIVMDVGKSLNPGVDIGQIEGGFMQGYGYYTLEEILFSPQGSMLSKGPGTYKLPGFSDIPLEFNVSLLDDSEQTRAIYSSKAVGEPPVFLAASVFFAIRRAIQASRKHAGFLESFTLNAPATCEKIRMACLDNFTDKISGSKATWNVVP